MRKIINTQTAYLDHKRNILAGTVAKTNAVKERDPESYCGAGSYCGGNPGEPLGWRPLFAGRCSGAC